MDEYPGGITVTNQADVIVVDEIQAPASRHEATVQPENLTPGQYFLNVLTGTQEKAIGVIVQ
jgi:hypothetical protein